jgi:hypothetical protein
MPTFSLSALKHLVNYNTNKNYCPQYSKIQRTRYSKEIDEIAQHEDKRRADKDADDRTLTAAKRAAAEDSGGDAVEFIEVAVGRWGD